jgi:hypothetical protein
MTAGWAQRSMSATNSSGMPEATEMRVPLIVCVCFLPLVSGGRRDLWTASS